MPSNNTKYSEEMREQTAAYIIETEKKNGYIEENMIQLKMYKEICFAILNYFTTEKA